MPADVGPHSPSDETRTPSGDAMLTDRHSDHSHRPWQLGTTVPVWRGFHVCSRQGPRPGPRLPSDSVRGSVGCQGGRSLPRPAEERGCLLEPSTLQGRLSAAPGITVRCSQWESSPSVGCWVGGRESGGHAQGFCSRIRRFGTARCGVAWRGVAWRGVARVRCLCLVPLAVVVRHRLSSLPAFLEFRGLRRVSWGKAKV